MNKIRIKKTRQTEIKHRYVEQDLDIYGSSHERLMKHNDTNDTIRRTGELSLAVISGILTVTSESKAS